MQRALALALLVLGLASITGLIIAPLWSLYIGYDSAVEDTARRLRTYRSVAESAPAIVEALESIKKREPQRYYLKETNPALAGAELQEVVKAAVEVGKGKLGSTQVAPVKEQVGNRQIAVTVQFSATTPGLHQIVHAIENAVPYLIVDSMIVRGFPTRVDKPMPGLQPEFQVQMTIYAYAQAVKS